MTTSTKSTPILHCPEFDETIRVGVDITKDPEGQWIHHTCYEELGYDDEDKKIARLNEFWNLDDDL